MKRWVQFLVGAGLVLFLATLVYFWVDSLDQGYHHAHPNPAKLHKAAQDGLFDEGSGPIIN